MAMYQIECAYTCHTGNIRANNEDNFWCFGESLPVNNEGTKGICSKIISGNRVPAMAVFDGMGGESCGEIAAFLASEEFGKFYNANKRMLRDMPEDFIDGVCEKDESGSMQIWDRASYSELWEAQWRCSSLHRSLCLPAILGTAGFILWTGGKLQQISTDHVLGGTAVGKAPLTQYLGLPEELQRLEPSVTEIEHKEGYRYLLCSDGVTDMLSDSEIEAILSQDMEISEIVNDLLESALQKGGRDNVTIVLCEVQKLDTSPQNERMDEKSER